MKFFSSLLLLLALSFSCMSQVEKKLVFVIQGSVADLETDTLIEGARVRLYLNGEPVDTAFTDSVGFYRFDTNKIAQSFNYVLLVDSKKHLALKGTGSLFGISKSTLFVHDFMLQNTYCPAPYHCDLDSLSDDVSTVYELMVKEQHIVLDLVVYVDERGRKYARKQAKAFVRELKRKGINPKRVAYRLDEVEKKWPRGFGGRAQLVILRDDFKAPNYE